MELAVYQPYLKERGGSEKVVKEIAEGSRHDITVITLLYEEEETFEEFQDLDVRVVGDEDVPTSFISQAVDFGLKPLFRELDLDEFDALLVSEGGLASTITFRNRDIPTAAYVHTPLRAALPEFKERYRERFHPILRPLYPLMISAFNLLEGYCWNNFDHVFANSQLTKSRILEKGIAEEDKIEVLNPGVHVGEETERTYDSYFLYPSRFEPYKRQELAIEAFERAELDGFELVLAGSCADAEYREQLEQKIEDKEDISLEFDVPGDRWEELMDNCYSVLFTAEKEDWGIVPLEAMAKGKPVISVAEGGPKEQINDGETGFLVEADAGAIADKMRELASNLGKVEEMGKKARERALDYSWEKFIKRFDKRVEEVAGR